MAETIADRARACFNIYHECLEAIPPHGGEEQRQLFMASADTNHIPLATRVEMQLGKFNLWTSNIGVFAPLKFSMDYRLRDAPDVRGLVLKLLMSLNGNLLHLKSLLASTQTGGGISLPLEQLLHQEANDDSSSVKKLGDAIESIADNMARMHRLTNAIRRGGTDVRNSRADKFMWKDEDGNDLGPLWEKTFALQLCERKYPNASPIIHTRLASAMLTRRKRILYRQSRLEKLALNTQQPEKVVIKVAEKKPIPVPETSSQFEHQAIQIQGDAKTGVQSQAKNSIQTFNTAATPLEPEKFQHSSAPSRVSSARSLPLDDETKAHFPLPPEIKNAEDIVCPYCCILLRAKNLENTGWWR